MTALLVILLLAAAGCGKKGALYLPDQPRPASKAPQSSEVPPPTQTP